MRVLLYDEMPPIDYEDCPPRSWCGECRRRTQYRYTKFGYRECLECVEEVEENHV